MQDLLISDKSAIDKMRGEVIRSAKKVVKAVEELVNTVYPPIEILATIKFTDRGWHPVEDRRLNLIEQVNQSFTYLVSLAAAEEILRRCPDSAPLRLNLGTRSGSDIESLSGTVAAEVFAAVRATNNRKLVRDVVKVAETDATHKFVFFFCPDEDARSFRRKRFPEVEIVALTAEQVWRYPDRTLDSARSAQRRGQRPCSNDKKWSHKEPRT